MAIKAEGVTRATEARRKEQGQYWVYLDGEFKRYADARLGLMTHALHYGTGVFEGIRGYWSPEHEQLFLLKLREHYRRMQNSVRSSNSRSRSPWMNLAARPSSSTGPTTSARTCTSHRLPSRAPKSSACGCT